MQEPEYPGLTYQQEKGLRLAVEGVCELCSGYFALEFLEVHQISRRVYREMQRDPTTRILIVCRECHRHIHRLPVRVRDQRAIVSRRSFLVRKDLRNAIGYRSKTYVPPEGDDPARMYDEFFDHFPPDSFRHEG
ncbi:MAG: hypothetical protein GX651_00285 [Methanomicrobiales archaeon]|nr:hypothetical protein [Methanomicrobiales archaeon]